MRKISLYIAATMDGFIAGPNGEIDWLDAGGDLDYGYKEFYESIETTLIGNSTYRPLPSLPEFPYRDKTNYVFIRGTPLRLRPTRDSFQTTLRPSFAR